MIRRPPRSTRLTHSCPTRRSSVLLPGQPRAQVLATEAGQVSLAPGNEREIEILRLFRREHAHVSFEDALSGPGLLKLYRALCELRGSVARALTQIGRAHV